VLLHRPRRPRHHAAIINDVLESITRRTILELAREQMSMEPCERDIDRRELYAADEAFFWGTGWELTPVTSIDRPAGGHRQGRARRASAAADVFRRGGGSGG
jgi:branched-subunit amino acid aminotransferase/4-amino-4-deoxychorismate lyase